MVSKYSGWLDNVKAAARHLPAHALVSRRDPGAEIMNCS
jgi:hypothetical protein